MNFPFYIAKRYVFSRSSNNAINIISKIALGGIVIGAMVLFVFMSIFSGLKEFSLSFSNNFDPDLKIIPKYGKSFLISEDQKRRIGANTDIAFCSKTIEEKVLFLYKNKEQVAYLKGVDSQYNLVNNVSKVMYEGQWLVPKTPQVVVGNMIAQKLSLGLFDLDNAFEIFVPKPGKGAISNPENAFNKSNLVPIGIYAVNDELDSKYVFADLELAQELLEFKPNQISGLEIKLSSKAKSETVVDDLNVVFSNQVIIKNRAQQNDSLYKMLNTENTVLYLICTLVIVLILFTLAGAIIMMVLDKKDNLRTLYNIGTPIADLRKIFLLQGTLLTVFGGFLGLFLGIIIVLIQQFYKVVMISESLAYPVIFNLQNVAIVLVTIIVLGFIASFIASSRVSKKLLE
ncbi:ABC transporter permease [Flavobacterium psychrophilum]|uniref:ABC transporter permease n=1 Tax=Flavobacterium psychrophilum TaxID=96345 RepID=A0A1Z5HG23_FLAPS|nr:FtsX-like permease family protein [Flavobacterium psychrophilum]AIN73173.1 membrane protein [Flavobacterium psychrophilum FPG3]EKT2070083.1 ABC transporter permease [Flavobacterium psychrophilum]EKT2072216.1 ABC transporter permease [Flavobacterium psychrophilum]EKT3964820.1 ABC transporter permease [Flavobacterium psychrophilum]EKT3965678.1 ABC transporter permease [Flavobacterium psychrophilum]